MQKQHIFLNKSTTGAPHHQSQPKRKYVTGMAFAFTLSEVLITMGIIGVIAAITLQILVQNSQEKATVGKLKKAFSSVANAYTLATQENGTPDTWALIGANSAPGAENMLNNFEPYFNITKKCGRNTGCFPSGNYRMPNGDPAFAVNSNSTYAKARLSDGSSIYYRVYDAACSFPVGGVSSVCGEFGVDTNGDKLPNELGVDLFTFYLSKSGITPMGTPKETFISFASQCSDKTLGIHGGAYNGAGCTAWVLYNENMDYLKCSGLSWTGKNNCE